MDDIKNFFKFLEDKEGKKTPLKYKLLYDPDSITSEDLVVEGDLNLNYSKITSLPDNLTVKGDLDLDESELEFLPNNLKVGETLYLSDTQVSSIPNNLQVGRHLYIINTPLTGKYSTKEIKKMIEDKGGYVRSIYL